MIHQYKFSSLSMVVEALIFIWEGGYPAQRLLSPALLLSKCGCVVIFWLASGMQKCHVAASENFPFKIFFLLFLLYPLTVSAWNADVIAEPGTAKKSLGNDTHFPENPFFELPASKILHEEKSPFRVFWGACYLLPNLPPNQYIQYFSSYWKDFS